MENILEIKNLFVYYGEKEILKNINMSIKKNKIVSIIGPSGCGKSTFLKTINHMINDEEDSKVEGTIFFNGNNSADVDKEKLRKEIGIVFQTPSPFPFSIYKNMTYAPIYYGTRNKEELDILIKNKLEEVGLYDEVKNDIKKSALKLSGGQQQRLCIARSLSVNPEILLLDEPCSALDIQNTMKIEKLLLKLAKRYTVVIVTHNLFQAKRISDYTGFFLNGQLIEFDTTEKIFNNPTDERTKKYISGIFG